MFLRLGIDAMYACYRGRTSCRWRTRLGIPIRIYGIGRTRGRKRRGGSGGGPRLWSASLDTHVLLRNNWGRALSIELHLVKRDGQILKLQLVVVDNRLDWAPSPLLLFVGRRAGYGRCGESGVYCREDIGEIPDNLGGRGEV